MVVVTVSADGQVDLHERGNGATSTVTLGQAADEDPFLIEPPVAISADGTTVMYLLTKDVPVVVDVIPGTQTRLSGLPSGRIEIFALSPDGSRAVVSGTASNVGYLWLWDVATTPIKEALISTAQPRFSPDGTILAIPRLDTGEIEIWDPMTGDSLGGLCCHLPGVLQPGLSNLGHQRLNGSIEPLGC